MVTRTDRGWFLHYIKQGWYVYVESELKKHETEYGISMEEMANYGPKENGQFGNFGEPLRLSIESSYIKNVKKVNVNSKPIIDLLIKSGAKVERGEKGKKGYFNAMRECFAHIGPAWSAEIPILIVKHMSPEYLNIPLTMTIQYIEYTRSFLDWAEVHSKRLIYDYSNQWKKLFVLLGKYGALTLEEIKNREKRKYKKIELEEMIARAERVLEAARKANKSKEIVDRIVKKLNEQYKELQTLIDEEIKDLEIDGRI